MPLSHISLPEKLSPDAIVEAVFEIRFETEKFMAEVVLGRMLSSTEWKDYTPSRLFASEIPSQIRDQDPNLAFQPLFELRAPAGNSAIRVGSRAVSYVRTTPYAGWKDFHPKIHSVIDMLFEVAPDLSLQRLGLRYINAMVPEAHGITSLADLNLKIDVAGEQLTGDVSLNFIVAASDGIGCTVRIGTPALMPPYAVPPGTALMIDVDVYNPSPSALSNLDANGVKDWLDRAHDIEKHHFFRLLQSKDIERLKAE